MICNVKADSGLSINHPTKKREESCLFAEAKGKEYTALPTLNQTVTSEQETRFSTKPPPDGQWTNARKTQSNPFVNIFFDFLHFFFLGWEKSAFAFVFRRWRRRFGFFGGGISVLRRLSLGFAAVWRVVVFLCAIASALAEFFGRESGRAGGRRFGGVGGIGFGGFLRHRVVG